MILCFQIYCADITSHPVLLLTFSLQLRLRDGGEVVPQNPAAGHPSSLLTGQSMCLINQRHAVVKQALHQRSADTLIHLSSRHNSTLPELGQLSARSHLQSLLQRWKNNLKGKNNTEQEARVLTNRRSIRYSSTAVF